MKRASLVVSTLAALLAPLACSKTVDVNLTLVEPCDQTNQALNGASSFSVATQGANVEGTPTDDVVTFTRDQGPQPVNVTLGDVTVTVKAFADDITTGGSASAIPQAVGRTMPLPIVETSGDQSLLVTVGKLDTFGKTTRADGTCTEMTGDPDRPGRHGHTATFVPVLNQVLIFGGAVFLDDGTETFLNTAELWDPATGEFETIGIGNGPGRAYHAASALPDGRVLISGGLGNVSGTVQTIQLAEIFDPVTKEFSSLLLKQPRAHHTSTVMEGAGVVALVGGCSGTSPADLCTATQAGAGNRGPSTNLVVTIETFDIESGVATVAVPNANGLATPRAFHQATSLENGTNTLLLVTGGANAEGPVCDVELFRVDGGNLTRVTNTPGVNLAFPANKCPVRHTAVAYTASADQQQHALILGGQTQAAAGAPAGTGSVDVFDFSTLAGITPSSAVLLNPRAGHTAARLTDNSILVVGGATGAGPTAEIIRPEAGTGLLASKVLAGAPGIARDKAALAVLPTNQVLLTGGHTLAPPFASVTTAELFFGP